MKSAILTEWPAPKALGPDQAPEGGAWLGVPHLYRRQHIGTGLTQASARTGAQRMLAIYEKQRKSPLD